MADKLPALHFYVQDYLADTRFLSNELKGFYVDLLCYMHKSSRRGYLNQANGQPYSPEDLAMMTGTSADRAAHLLLALINSEVISATHQGIPFSRRMVRDEKKRQTGIKFGIKGGNPTLKGRVKGGGYPFSEDENETVKGSSSSGKRGGGGKPKTPMPDDWQPTPETLDWCAQNNLPDPNYQRLQFVAYWQEKRERRADWQLTFRKWMTSPYRKDRPNGQQSHESAADRNGRRLREEVAKIAAGAGAAGDREVLPLLPQAHA